MQARMRKLTTDDLKCSIRIIVQFVKSYEQASMMASLPSTQRGEDVKQIASMSDVSSEDGRQNLDFWGLLKLLHR